MNALEVTDDIHPVLGIETAGRHWTQVIGQVNRFTCMGKL